jgi:hypothetical protein
MVDVGRERTEIGTQEGTEHDGTRETHHLFSHIRRLPAQRDPLPLCGGLSCSVGHDAGQRGDALAVEGWLRDAPLPQPEFILARQQTVTERHPQLGVERTLVVIARVVLQDMPNIRGVRDEEATPRTDLEVDDVAVPTSSAHEHGRWIASQSWQHPEEWNPARARWKHTYGLGGFSHPTRRL